MWALTLGLWLLFVMLCPTHNPLMYSDMEAAAGQERPGQGYVVSTGPVIPPQYSGLGRGGQGREGTPSAAGPSNHFLLPPSIPLGLTLHSRCQGLARQGPRTVLETWLTSRNLS